LPNTPIASKLPFSRPTWSWTAVSGDWRNRTTGCCALGFTNVFEITFGLVHTPDRTKANRQAYMWDKIKNWLLHGAIEADEKMAADLVSPRYHINRSNLLVLESKADIRKRGQSSPDDGDALAADVRAARGAGGGRRRGGGGKLRAVHREQQLGVDAMTPLAGARPIGSRHGRSLKCRFRLKVSSPHGLSENSPPGAGRSGATLLRVQEASRRKYRGPEPVLFCNSPGRIGRKGA
jgi:hypothetical protein